MTNQRAWLGFLFALALPASAQNALPRLSGTITQTRDGQTLKANVFWQAPDSLKIEVLNPKNEVARTILALGDQTFSFDSSTKRARVLNANIAREWFRGWNIAFGGPANFALTGGKEFLAAPDQGVTLVRDRTLFGQDSERAYYIAWKKPVRAFPAKITIENGVRSDFDDAALPLLSARPTVSMATPLMRATISFDAQHLPQRAEVEAGGEKISFIYALQARAGDFPGGTFALPDAAKDALREEESLRAPSSYADGTPDELFNHGAALWNSSGDASGALTLWARASAANPRASAPKLSTFDVALATRQSGVAARALEALKSDLSEADAAWLRARLDALRGERDAVAQDLKTASSTGDPTRLLAYSLAQKAVGDLSGARATWNSLLATSVARDVQAQAAENLAVAATPAELASLGATLSGDAEALRLARALLDLRGGKTSDATFDSPELGAAMARGLERSNEDEAARRAWESLESNANLAVQNTARAHLVTLAARVGDASRALSVWSRWSATTRSETERVAAQNILFDAFQKAFKTNALRVALLNRATSMGAKDLDLRLSLAFQEQFGSDADIAKALGAGFDRFGTVPFWQGKEAENLVSKAFLMMVMDDFGFKRRAATFKQALDLLDSAIKSSPGNSFYVQQKALLLVQRGSQTGGVIDANESSQAASAARAQLAELDAQSDPDLTTIAALGWNAFPSREDKEHAVAAAQKALDSPPVDGDRTTLVFANRQVLARVLDANGAARQWKALLDVSRLAGDEAGLVSALLAQLETRKDAQGMAQLLVRIAGERWPLDAHLVLLNGAASRIVRSPMLPQVAGAFDAAALQKTTGEERKSTIVAGAALSIARLALANGAIAQPGAPPEADAELERATSAQAASLTALQPLAESDEPFWSSRARLLLLNGPTLSPDAKTEMLRQLAAREKGEPSVALALANTQSDPKVRAQTASTLEFSLETWRRLSLDALSSGDREGAAFWSSEAFNFAAHAPEVSANEFQRIAFARAKIAWQTGLTSVASTIYTGLSSNSWGSVDRAAALLALHRRLEEAGRKSDADALTPQMQALGLSQTEAPAAVAFLEVVEN